MVPQRRAWAVLAHKPFRNTHHGIGGQTDRREHQRHPRQHPGVHQEVVGRFGAPYTCDDDVNEFEDGRDADDKHEQQHQRPGGKPGVRNEARYRPDEFHRKDACRSSKGLSRESQQALVGDAGRIVQLSRMGL